MVVLVVLILIMCLFVRLIFVRKRLMAFLREWRDRMVVFRWKGAEMPCRADEYGMLVGSKSEVKRKMSNTYKRHLRKGRIEEFINDKGEKNIRNTEKMKNYAK